MWRNRVLLAVAAAAAGSVVAATPATGALRDQLAPTMRQAGTGSSAYVFDTDTNQVLYSSRGTTRRIPASVQKLYTTITSLRRHGPDGRIETAVSGTGQLDADGVWRGDLYLEGRGDPTFGTSAVTALAQRLKSEAGIRRVAGTIYADETYFDSLRGVPDSGYRTSPYIGPLSALGYNQGYVGGVFQTNPPYNGSRGLRDALRRINVRVDEPPDVGEAPADAQPVSSISSAPLAAIVRSTLLPSNNYFAEMLLKEVGATYGGQGSTAVGAAVVARELAPFGANPKIADGSGLSRTNLTSPRDVTRVLDRMVEEPQFDALLNALPAAGYSGTLAYRMRGTRAQGNCSAKTGTLVNVSALAGYCRARNGHRVAFAFLMNRVSVSGARALQDSMTVRIANWRG